MRFCFLMCGGVCLHVVSVSCTCLAPVAARRGRQIPWNRSHRWLGAALWVLGTETRSFERAATEPYLQGGFVLISGLRKVRVHHVGDGTAAGAE